MVKNLGTITTDVVVVLRSLDSGLDAVRAFGAPSECSGIVIRSAAKELVEILAGHGLTAEAFLDLVEARTSPRFVYFSGFGEVADLARRAKR